jgi:hypothetical protein
VDLGLGIGVPLTLNVWKVLLGLPDNNAVETLAFVDPSLARTLRVSLFMHCGKFHCVCAHFRIFYHYSSLKTKQNKTWNHQDLVSTPLEELGLSSSICFQVTTEVGMGERIDHELVIGGSGMCVNDENKHVFARLEFVKKLLLVAFSLLKFYIFSGCTQSMFCMAE